MTSILQFPGPSRKMDVEDAAVDGDQVHALRAMLRYLHREASEGGLRHTAAAITQTLAVLDVEVRDRAESAN